MDVAIRLDGRDPSRLLFKITIPRWSTSFSRKRFESLDVVSRFHWNQYCFILRSFLLSLIFIGINIKIATINSYYWYRLPEYTKILLLKYFPCKIFYGIELYISKKYVRVHRYPYPESLVRELLKKNWDGYLYKLKSEKEREHDLIDEGKPNAKGKESSSENWNLWRFQFWCGHQRKSWLVSSFLSETMNGPSANKYWT